MLKKISRVRTHFKESVNHKPQRARNTNKYELKAHKTEDWRVSSEIPNFLLALTYLPIYFLITVIKFKDHVYKKRGWKGWFFE